MQCFFFTAEK